MKRLSFLAVFVLLTAGVARADLKVGYVDLQRALAEVAEGQSAKARLANEVEKKKNEVKAEQAKLVDDKAILDKQGAMMSEEVRNQKYAELQRRLLEFSQKYEKMQVDLAEQERRELKKIFEKMDPIIAGIAQREGLTMVFEKTDSGLVYAPASLDLTNELVRTYNDKYPVKGGVKAPGGAKAPANAPPPAPAAPAAPPAEKKP